MPEINEEDIYSFVEKSLAEEADKLGVSIEEYKSMVVEYIVKEEKAYKTELGSKQK